MPEPWVDIAMGCISLAMALGVAQLLIKAGFPLPDERFRTGNLDGLRGYLALSVMICHYAAWHGYSRTGVWLAPDNIVLRNLGNNSVVVFFMITGYLFYPKIRGGPSIDWARLYTSRVFRILPLQTFVVALVSVVSFLETSGTDRGTLLHYLVRVGAWLTSFSQPKLFGYEKSAFVNAPVLWSLHYEWCFYLLALPVLAIAHGIAFIRSRPVLVPIIMLATGYVAHAVHPAPLFLDSLPIFAAGAIISLLAPRIDGGVLKGPVVGAMAIVAYLALLACSRNSLSPAILVTMAMVFLTIIKSNPLLGLVSSKAAILLGEISFDIYMLHGIILFTMFDALRLDRHLPSHTLAPLLLPVAMLATVLFATAAYLAIDRPFIALGRRLARRRGAVADAPSSVVSAP